VNFLGLAVLLNAIESFGRQHHVSEVGVVRNSESQHQQWPEEQQRGQRYKADLAPHRTGKPRTQKLPHVLQPAAMRPVQGLMTGQRQAAQPLDQVGAVLPIAREGEVLAQLAVADRHFHGIDSGRSAA
jgi:hypothetical protein